MMEHPNLDRLFNPSNIAMIGASSQLRKWGNLIFLNIMKGNYAGQFFPVNPKLESLCDIPCYPTVLDIPKPVDLALITTPAKAVPALIEQCGQKKIPFVVIFTANFSETGEKGVQLEEETLAIARSYGIRLVGPNMMGIFSAKCSLHALMPTLMPIPGNVSMFSQSGNVGVQMMDYGQKEGVGFNKFVSSGNEADLSFVDFITYFANDQDTKVIIGYVEGFDANTDFLRRVRKISREKPIVILKGGRTRAGMSAAASHTGALAGADLITQAALKQAGVVHVNSSLELIDCAKAFSKYPIPKGNRVGIVTRGGGWGVITADACETIGLEVPPLPKEIIEKVNTVLPEYWNKGNPIDLVATISHDPMPDCLRFMAEWDGVDAIISLGAGFQSFNFQKSPDFTGSDELLRMIETVEKFFVKDENNPDKSLTMIGELVQQYGKPIFSVSTGSETSHRRYMEQYGIVTFPTPERAVRTLKHMWEYHRISNREMG